MNCANYLLNNGDIRIKKKVSHVSVYSPNKPNEYATFERDGCSTKLCHHVSCPCLGSELTRFHCFDLVTKSRSV